MFEENVRFQEGTLEEFNSRTKGKFSKNDFCNMIIRVEELLKEFLNDSSTETTETTDTVQELQNKISERYNRLDETTILGFEEKLRDCGFIIMRGDPYEKPTS